MQDTGMYGINLERVINSHEAWAINKVLATKLSVHPHFTIGEFFQSMSDDDVEFLGKNLAETNFEDHASAELFLMMMLLSIAEGLSIGDDDHLEERFDMLTSFITIESLRRKGMVEIKYENMSFGEDLAKADLVRATPAGISMVAQALKDENQDGNQAG